MKEEYYSMRDMFDEEIEAGGVYSVEVKEALGVNEVMNAFVDMKEAAEAIEGITVTKVLSETGRIERGVE